MKTCHWLTTLHAVVGTKMNCDSENALMFYWNIWILIVIYIDYANLFVVGLW